ncbi:ubiquitin carboxyl-terminal hydrolase 15 [Trichonephila clavata]|uniref:ubiquitinyl hydrolase 1 n=1 Tax=Trichonephila clavata TaxID=2740835 RepID=A0A8X6FMW0_TRICU|nr:ubiquitin carboxyl-terminal hydrolase 15 [Trichonephila clavata]
MCSDDEMINDKNMATDFTTLGNLEILNTCQDNVFNGSNVMMECFSDINNSPDPFDIPSIDNDDSVLPVYGPFAELDSQSSFETDVLDVNAVPGVCGLRNLGNTCFMNAGLQCLLNNKIFKSYFAETDMDSFVKGTLSYKFAELMKKIWSGSYSTLHLGEFKECFGDMYIQFRNFRQHDCQEFLALLLDTMHEELNSSNKGKIKARVEHSFASINNCKDFTSPEASRESEAITDCEKSMDVCDVKEFICKNIQMGESSTSKTSEPSTSKIQADSTSSIFDVKNSNSVVDVPGTVKMKPVPDSNAVIYERNTEKMADLLINNKKLDKILNKNELDVHCNSESQSNCDVKMKTVEKIEVNENIVEKNELAYKLNSVQKIPSLDDFVKTTKTLNTNVSVVEETNNLFKFDSEKFPKHESNRLQETVDNLGQIVDLGPKQGGVKRVKITNIIHEKHKILEKPSEQLASCTTLHKRLKIENADANLVSSLPEQEDTVDMEPVPGDESSEGSSQSSELYTINSDCQELLVADEIRRAYSDWDHYKALNQSIIVDTFHGQFRSSVVCSECSHNSITYEPFMYLPVFLPHTLERQLIITYVQNNGSAPIRYLVNVNKYDRILKIREAVQKLLDTPAEEIILAEVFENHISRILDENQSIRRVNDSTRSIYAFEVGKNSELISELSKNSSSDPLILTEALDLTDEENILKNNPNDSTIFDASPSCMVGRELDQTCDSYKNSSPALDEQNDKTIDFTSVISNTSNDISLQEEIPNFTGPIQFHTCAICLEELPSYRLSLHPNCECILCNTCIEVSCKHYGGVTFICPVCSTPVSPADDFVPLNRMGDYEFKISTIPIPIVTRHDTFQEGVLKEKVLIGHPGLLKLPSSLPASKLYEHVDRAIPFLSTYSLLLVDGQGMNCSRCLYNKHCSGCEITRVGDVKLHPGDNIAVRYIDLPSDSITSASFVVEHKSLQETRHKSELDIYDCLEYFSERESLDADSPWYCPVCRQNQQATKSLSVWKFPEVLIIYLKRFVFHNFVSIKVEDKVSYPLEGLDLSSYSSGPYTEDLIYDLQACVCHFGGVSAGHYTSYSKHVVTNEWYYFNDESVKKEAPNTDDCVNEYIFFYQKR